MKLSIEERNKLIMANIGLIQKVARKYCNLFPGYEFDDFVNAGVEGVAFVIDRYDYLEKIKPSVVIYFSAVRGISDFISQISYVPRNMYLKNKKGVITEKSKKLLENMQNRHSLDYELFKDCFLKDILVSSENIENDIEQEELFNAIYETINSMSDRIREVFIEHYFNGKGFRDMAKDKDMSHQAVYDYFQKNGIRQFCNKFKELYGESISSVIEEIS